MQILLGCGSNRTKKLVWRGRSEWDGLVTLDHESSHKPDIVWDMSCGTIPFDDSTADEIHAYEVLEHMGQQGDWRFFFDQWTDFWRVLKPGGVFLGSVPLPSSPWALGDPSHTRIIPKESFIFLSQAEYQKQVGITPMSDFRSYYKADFSIEHLQEDPAGILYFVLKAIK